MISVTRSMNKNCILLAAMLLLMLVVPQAGAQEGAHSEKSMCLVYFTGIGCPHCANADPYVLKEMLTSHPEAVVIEYEIYQAGENAPLLYEYDGAFGSGLGVPLLIFGSSGSLIGDVPIIQGAEGLMAGLAENGCPLPDGRSVPFGELDIAGLPGSPKIWTKDRILVPGGSSDSVLMKSLLTEENISDAVEGAAFSLADAQPAPLSGGSVEFRHALVSGGAKFQWNGECIESAQEYNETCDNSTLADGNETRGEMTIMKLLSLAAVDAVNPCALTVLTLMLIAIFTYNPGSKKNILLAGLAFTVSVFVMYIVYGLVIIKLFQLIQAITYIRLTLYKVLGLAAIVLGLLNIKDFIRYKPGGLATEMPMFMRPRLKKIIGGITSPSGAFLVGAFVTVFLLPCTIGPYIIAGGILSAMDIIETIPLLMLYNLVFVLPMLAITIVVYMGFRKTGDVSGWKDKNIRHLHLVAGTVIILLGIAMVMGWV